MGTAERILAQVGWLVAAMLLVAWVGSQQLALRLDWLQFGEQYRAQMAQVVGALNQQNERLTRLEARPE